MIELTKEQLEKLGLNEEQIQEVFRLNGIAVNNVRSEVTTLEVERDNLKNQLKTANDEIEGYKDMDIDTIKANAEKYKEDFEKLEKESKKEIERIKYEHQLSEYINGFKFSNDRVKNSILSDIKAKEFKLEDGKFVGADDYMKELQESEPESFVNKTKDPDKKIFTGFIPGEGKKGDDDAPKDVGSLFAQKRNQDSKVKTSLWD